MAFFPTSPLVFLALWSVEADGTRGGSAIVVRGWKQTHLSLNPLGLSSDVSSSKRPSLTTLPLTVLTTIWMISLYIYLSHYLSQ